MLAEDFALNFRASATTQVQMDAGAIVEAMRASAEFFIQFFLAEELEFPVPPFHVATWDLMNDDAAEQIAAALPRGTAKTTLAKLTAVRHFLFTDTRFVVYVSNTASVAAEACKDIINYMRSPNYEAVFGKLEFEVEQDGRGFYKFWLQYVDTVGMLRKKFCILRAIGAGQQVRGLNIDNTRPELAIVDDLESDENTATKELQLKLKTWFYGPFIKAMSRKRRKIIFIGNMLSNRSLLYHFCETSEEWHSMRYGILLSNGEPLWPEIWSLEEIRKDFLEYQSANLVGRWFAEMMNMPIADGNLLIDAEDIYYVPHLMPGEEEAAFITVDPAISQKTHSDDTAIAVHALVNGLWRVVETVVGKYTPDQLFMILLALCQKWDTRCVGIEMAGYQAALKFLFEVLMQVHQQQFSIFEVPHKNKPKYERISVWCSLIRKKQWAVEEGDYVITEQLLMYDPAKKNNRDDLIDACSMGVTMTEMYMAAILDRYQLDPSKYQVIPGIRTMSC